MLSALLAVLVLGQPVPLELQVGDRVVLDVPRTFLQRTPSATPFGRGTLAAVSDPRARRVEVPIGTEGTVTAVAVVDLMPYVRVRTAKGELWFAPLHVRPADKQAEYHALFEAAEIPIAEREARQAEGVRGTSPAP